MNNDDKKLGQFLMRNRPEPRSARADEPNRIWAAIQQPAAPYSLKAFMRGTSLAAALAVVLILARGPVGTPQEQENAAVVSETVGLIFESDGGEEVFALAAVLGDE